MNEIMIYPIIIIAFLIYKKYTYYKVLKLAPSLLEQGGQIIDVRTEGEFALAHKQGSINIPLASLKNKINELDKNKPIIVCCASGSRSAFAKRVLIKNGFENVHNAGKWNSLLKLK